MSKAAIIRAAATAAVVLILTMQTGHIASLARAESLADLARAYVDATKDKELAGAALASAKRALETREAERVDRVKALEQERSQAMIPLLLRRVEAERQLAVARALPEMSDEEFAVEQAVQNANAAAEVARERHGSILHFVRRTAGDIAISRVHLERLPAQIEQTQADLDEAKAKLSRIETGDSEILMDAAREALQEKQVLLDVMREFEHAYKEAKTTPRMLIATKIPPLLDASKKFREVTTSYCGYFKQSLGEYITNGLKGIESFARGGKDGVGVVHLQVAEIYAQKPEKADQCESRVALAAMSDAKALAEATEARLHSLEAERAGLQGNLAVLEAKAHELRAAAEQARDEADRLGREASTTVQHAGIQQQLFDASRADLQVKRQNAIKEAEAALATANDAIQGTESDFASRVAAAAANDDQKPLSDVQRRFDKASTGVLKAEGDLLDRYFADEIRQAVQIESEIQNDGVDEGACVTVHNRGRFAIKSVRLALRANGRLVFDVAQVNPLGRDTISFKQLREALKNVWTTAEDSRAGMPAITFKQENRYKEWVPYLLPGQKSGARCWAFSRAAFQGDSLRRLEAAGIANSGRGWRFELLRTEATEIALSRPDPKRAGALLFDTPHLRDLYSDRLKAVLRGDTAASEIASVPDRPSSTTAGSASSSSRDDLKAVQARLNDLGYDAGTPDGVMGPKTRRAIAAFQRSRNLAPTGEPDEATVTSVLGVRIAGVQQAALVPRPAPAATDPLHRIRAQLGKCWLVPAVILKNDITVEVDIEVNPDGSIERTRIVDQARMRSDHEFVAAAEALLRAARNPSCQPLDIEQVELRPGRLIRLSMSTADIRP